MEEKTLAATDSVQVSGIVDVQRKMHFTGTVVKTTLAGAVVDIGLDTPGVVHISQLKKEPVNRVEDVVGRLARPSTFGFAGLNRKRVGLS